MKPPELPAETGTVVIGGGTGGAACAGVLAEHGTEPVLLLEAGPDYGPYRAGGWPGDILDARAIPLSHDWGLSTEADHKLDLPRARVLGGCSSHNGCTAAIGAREDYDEWAALGNPGWSAADVEPLLEWARRRFRVRVYAMDELMPAQAAFVAAGLACGLPVATDLHHLEAGVGIGPMATNIVDGVRWNSAFAFLDPVRDRPWLRISGGVLVDRILFEGATVRGVRVVVDGEPRVIRAQRVVLSAGTYHSPAVLLRSGIGPADDTRHLGIDPVVSLPGVGSNLLDHPCVQQDFAGGAGFAASMQTERWAPDEQTVGRARSSRCDQGPYDIHVFMVAGANSGHPGLPPISLYGGAMRARSQGRVSLRSTDPSASPVIDHRYGSDPDGHDRAVLSEALGLLKEMTTVPELAALLGDEVTPAYGDPLDRIVNYCHPAGTCKLGPAADPMAVVAANGGVHGTEGLYVADASIMPTITRANINLPTAMIGARVAAAILGRTPTEVASAG